MANKALTVANEDDESEEHMQKEFPGKNSMQAFRDELDKITNKESANFDNIIRRAKTSISSKHTEQPPSPETLVSKHDAHYSSSPMLERRIDRIGTPRTAPTASNRSTRTEREPSPIHTPAFQISSTTLSPDVYHHGNENRTEDDNYLGQQSTWFSLVDAMRDTLDRQDSLIRHLQRDNDILRTEIKQLKSQQRQQERADTASHPSPVVGNSTYNRMQSAGAQTYPRHVLTPPRQKHTESLANSRSVGVKSNPPQPVRPPVSWHYAGYRDDDHDPVLLGRAGFSPGTQFVAELSQVVDLEPTHQVPLSIIMDKHWDRVSQIRQKNGWSR